MAMLVINNYADKEDQRAKAIGIILAKEGNSAVITWHFSDILGRELPRNLKAIVLSGSAAHLKDRGVPSEFQAEVNLLRASVVPVLGICFGHQLIGKMFGSDLGSLPKFLDGPEDVRVLVPDDILRSWKAGDLIRVRQSHEDFVEDVPSNFTCLAESTSCKVEAMKHETRPLYGIQAHVERATVDEPDGLQVIRNFLKTATEKDDSGHL